MTSREKVFATILAVCGWFYRFGVLGTRVALDWRFLASAILPVFWAVFVLFIVTGIRAVHELHQEAVGEWESYTPMVQYEGELQKPPRPSYRQGVITAGVLCFICVGVIFVSARLWLPVSYLNASLDYIACGCVVPAPEQPHQTDIKRKVVVLYIVTLDPVNGETRIDESSIACYTKFATLNGSDEELRGKSTTDLYGIAIYAMGDEESINQDDWLAEAAFKGPIKDKIRKRVACEMPQVGNPMYLLFNTNVRFFLSFKESSGKLHILQAQLAEPPMPMRRRNTLIPGVDRKFLGLSMDNVPPRLTDIKPAMLINFAARVSPDGKPVGDAISKTNPLSFPMTYGFELCSYH